MTLGKGAKTCSIFMFSGRLLSCAIVESAPRVAMEQENRVRPFRRRSQPGAFGPVKALAASLDEDRRRDLREAFVGFYGGYQVEGGGVSSPREYVVIVGQRREGHGSAGRQRRLLRESAARKPPRAGCAANSMRRATRSSKAVVPGLAPRLAP